MATAKQKFTMEALMVVKSQPMGVAGHTFEMGGLDVNQELL